MVLLGQVAGHAAFHRPVGFPLELQEGRLAPVPATSGREGPPEGGERHPGQRVAHIPAASGWKTGGSRTRAHRRIAGAVALVGAKQVDSRGGGGAVVAFLHVVRLPLARWHERRGTIRDDLNERSVEP